MFRKIFQSVASMNMLGFQAIYINSLKTQSLKSLVQVPSFRTDLGI